MEGGGCYDEYISGIVFDDRIWYARCGRPEVQDKKIITLPPAE